MKQLIILSIILLISACKTNVQDSRNIDLQRIVRKEIERAYFEGQKDYSMGDIRIMQNESGCWYWNKSPWDDGSTPIYNLYENCDSLK